MALLAWNHARSVGVRAMNDQHGILMDTVNELRLAAVHGSSREQLCGLLDQFIKFSRMHFASEEQLMQSARYPGLDEHRDQHQQFMAQILHSAHRLQYGEAVEMGALTCFLGYWFIQHIDGYDQHYGPCLNERGIQ